MIILMVSLEGNDDHPHLSSRTSVTIICDSDHLIGSLVFERVFKRSSMVSEILCVDTYSMEYLIKNFLEAKCERK